MSTTDFAHLNDADLQQFALVREKQTEEAEDAKERERLRLEADAARAEVARRQGTSWPPGTADASNYNAGLVRGEGEAA